MFKVKDKKMFLIAISLIIFGIVYLINMENEDVENPRGYYLKVGVYNDNIYKLA